MKSSKAKEIASFLEKLKRTIDLSYNRPTQLLNAIGKDVDIDDHQVHGSFII